jgi:hypothetical protein
VAANTKSVTQIIAGAMQKAGVEGMDDRHPAATMLLWFNDVWAHLRLKLANNGIQGLTVPGSSTALPTAPPTGERYLSLPFPDHAVGVYGVDILKGDKWDPLDPGSFAQRRDYQRSGARYPTHWLTLSLPAENGSSAPTAGAIMVWPDTTHGDSYRIWYLKAWVRVTDAATLIYGHDTWHEWAEQALVRLISQKDNDANGTLEEARIKQAEVWADIKRGVQNMNLAQPIQRVRRDRRRSR